MICKYCGAEITNGRCSACGKPIQLVNRSDDLNRWMSQTNSGNQERTYQQGLSEGYRNGLEEGYRKASTARSESRNLPAQMSSFRIIPVILVSIIVCILAGAISGMVYYRNGYDHGKLIGFSEGMEVKEAENALNYQSGYEKGTSEGYDQGYADGANNVILSYFVNQDTEIGAIPVSKPIYSKASNSKKALPGVKDIQLILNSVLKSDIHADGYYGDTTEAAIKEFQTVMKTISSDVEETGSVDQRTLVYLFYAYDNPEGFIGIRARYETNKGSEENTVTNTENIIDDETQESVSVLSSPVVSSSASQLLGTSQTPAPLFSTNPLSASEFETEGLTSDNPLIYPELETSNESNDSSQYQELETGNEPNDNPQIEVIQDENNEQ